MSQDQNAAYILYAARIANILCINDEKVFAVYTRTVYTNHMVTLVNTRKIPA